MQLHKAVLCYECRFNYFTVIFINYNLAECLGGQIGGVPPLANRVEKSDCSDKTVARILN